MRLLTLFTALAAILHTTSALPYSAPFPFPSFIGLSECAKSCKSHREAAIHCLPPDVPVLNPAAYIACFCQSQWLRGVKDNGGPCAQECIPRDEETIRDTYRDMCGIPSPSSTVFLSTPAPETSPTSTPVPSTSIVVALTTSMPITTPASTSAPPAEEPKVHSDHHETRAHKYRVAIAVPVAIVIFGILVFSWLAYRHYTHTHKPRTRVRERGPSQKELLLANHQKLFDDCQRRKPLLIVDNSRRARLCRWLKGEKICPAEGQEVYELQEMNSGLRAKYGVKYNLKKNEFVIDKGSRIWKIRNRRSRFTHDSWVHANESLPQAHALRDARADPAPRRPSSSRTEASSVGQRYIHSSLDSPWRAIAPPLPIRPSTLQTLWSPLSSRSPAPLPTAVYRQASSPLPPARKGAAGGGRRKAEARGGEPWKEKRAKEAA